MATAAPQKDIEPPPSRIADTRGALPGGAFAGLVAGAVMFLTAVMHSVMTGASPARPGRLIAATFLGPAALESGAGRFFLGLGLHLLVSAGWGVVFARLVPRWTPGRWAFAGGLLFGAVVWLVMTHAVLPIANPTMNAAVADNPSAWFFFHLVFGGVLYMAPSFRREAP